MTSASFVFLAALALAAMLGLLARTWSHDRARYRAMVTHEQTGQDQPGWDRRYAWSPTPAPVAAANRTSAPVSVTATVTGPHPPKWWERPSPRQAPRPGSAGTQPPLPSRAPGEPQAPATHDRVVVDEQPATVTGVERVGHATRVYLLRDDGQTGFVDIPDVDAAVPMAPSGAPASPIPSAPAGQGQAAPGAPTRPTTRPAAPSPAPQATAVVTSPATTAATRKAPLAGSVTLGGITVSFDKPAPAGQRPAQQDISPAEQRRRYLAAQGYTGPTDADGYPVFDTPGMAAPRAAG